ncbi:hypothetical protein [Ferrovibrio sp.]|uniref:hypothetical protein n=1 Tax=Ferrovibrio sp. TaxID=1917215 RepID=UPI0025BA0B6F|nr:hypothetical protein [Ferrovibrio sp.]MBX3454579.1 hypothetical protein [Ferrovibrio sp.]
MELALKILRYLWYGFLGLVALCVLGVFLLLKSCEKQGVADPEGFFHAQRAELEQAVQELSSSGISEVRVSTPYRDADKDYVLESDDALYQQLQGFLDKHDMLTIGVLREKSLSLQLREVSFTVLIDRTSGRAIIYDINYTPPGRDYSALFEDETCRILEAPSWRLCWRPA